MQKPLLGLLTLTLTLVAAASAPLMGQGSRAVHVTSLPGPLGRFHYHEDARFWAASIQGDKKTVVAGSVIAQASNVLKASNDLRLILVDNKTGEIPSVVVAEESLGNNQYRYWGLDVVGRWHKSITLTVPANSLPKTNFGGDQMASVTGGKNMVVFNMWLGQWLVFPLLGSTVVTNGVNVTVMKTGTTLVGYSAYGSAVKILRNVASNAEFLSGTVPNDSACLCYKIGEKEVAFFSGLLETWTRLKLSTTVTKKYTFVEYGEHCCAVQDGNTLHVFSAVTGQVHAQAFKDLTAVLGGDYAIDDNTCVFLDKKASPPLGYVFCCRSGKYHSVAISSAAKIHVDSEWGMIEDGNKFSYVSGARLGGVVKTLSLGTEKIRQDKNGVRNGLVTDDATFILVTDKAAYGYSAVLNLVSRRPLTTPATKWSGQDWLCYYQTASGVYTMSMRDGRWYPLPIKVTPDDVEDTDGLVKVQDKANQRNWYFGGEARGWTWVPALGTNQIDSLVLEHGGFVANGRKGGGTDLHLYSSIFDDVVAHSTSAVFKKGDFINTTEAVYAVDRVGRKVIVLTTHSDITPQEAWPLAFRGSAGKPTVRWVLRGQPTHAWWMNFAIRRGQDLRIPSVQGALRLDPVTLFPNVLSGSFDARGVSQVTTVIPFGMSGYLQMFTFRRSGSTVSNFALSQIYGITIQ